MSVGFYSFDDAIEAADVHRPDVKAFRQDAAVRGLVEAAGCAPWA